MAVWDNPPNPQPTDVQWHYSLVEDGRYDNRAHAGDAQDGSDRFLIKQHRTTIADRQLGLVKIEPEMEAFSLKQLDPHDRIPIFFFGGTLTPLCELKDEITPEEMLKRRSKLVYAKLITNLGKTFWLRYFRHWHVQLDENNLLLLPSQDSSMRHQQIEAIKRLHTLTLYGHLTLADAIEVLANCSHKNMECEETAPWNMADNYICPFCGLGYSVDTLIFHDEDDTHERFMATWPEEVRRIGRDFAGLVFNGTDDMCFYRSVMVDMGLSHRHKVPGWLDRDGQVLVA